MKKYAGYFKNGDQWDECELIEDGKRYFIAIDAQGNEYETLEMPTRYPLFTMLRFEGAWTGNDVKNYMENAK
jgi:hypothetical protein